MKIRFIPYIIFSFMFFACQKESPAPKRMCSASNLDSKLSLNDNFPEELSYQKDILPILKSSKDGKVYKCTVCHSWMEREDLTKEQAEMILESIQSGSMPRGETFDTVADEDLNLIESWISKKFIEVSNQNNENNVSDESSHENLEKKNQDANISPQSEDIESSANESKSKNSSSNLCN